MMETFGETFSSNGKWYCEENQNLAVMLKVDWFQQFKHMSKFSVGEIDLVVSNLPRNKVQPCWYHSHCEEKITNK